MTNFGKRMTIRELRVDLDRPPVRECDEELSAMLARVLVLVEACRPFSGIRATYDIDIVQAKAVDSALAAMKEAGDID